MDFHKLHLLGRVHDQGKAGPRGSLMVHRRGGWGWSVVWRWRRWRRRRV